MKDIIIKYINRAKQNAVKYHPIPSDYCSSVIELLEEALLNPIIEDNYLLVGDIQKRFLEKRKSSLTCIPEIKWLDLTSPINCFRWKILRS